MSEDDTKRVVMTTSSLGMGVNIKDVRLIIHYGPPVSLEDYIQGIGRAGRNGQQSTTKLYCTGQQLGKCSKEMKAYGKTSEGCLRVSLCSAFDNNT